MSPATGGARRAAVAAVAVLAVAAPVLLPGGYSRAEFGGWTSVAGCDTRERVLADAALLGAVDLDGDGCRDDGPVVDFYTGLTLDPHLADVDHVVALEAAWRAAAAGWDRPRRVAFANDRRNLAVTALSINRAKGSLGPARWRPPGLAGACRYAVVYRDVSRVRALPVSGPDAVALRDMCPDPVGPLALDGGTPPPGSAEVAGLLGVRSPSPSRCRAGRLTRANLTPHPPPGATLACYNHGMN
jgi:hypothetical protein